jgi:hypothetical protein
MDAKSQTKKKLVLPAALAVAVLASGCGNAVTSNDAAPTDGAVADAGTFDAGCVPPEVYDPVAHACVPLV